jgi:hypothetical protein
MMELRARTTSLNLGNTYVSHLPLLAHTQQTPPHQIKRTSPILNNPEDGFTK